MAGEMLNRYMENYLADPRQWRDRSGEDLRNELIAIGASPSQIQEWTNSHMGHNPNPIAEGLELLGPREWQLLTKTGRQAPDAPQKRWLGRKILTGRED
jgi:hypothetical protein